MATQVLLESVAAVIETLNPTRSRGSLASQAEDCAPIVEALGYVDLAAFLRSYYATPHGEASAVREQAAAANGIWARHDAEDAANTEELVDHFAKCVHPTVEVRREDLRVLINEASPYLVTEERRNDPVVNAIDRMGDVVCISTGREGLMARQERREFEQAARALGMLRPDGSFDHDWVDAEAEEARRGLFSNTEDEVVTPRRSTLVEQRVFLGFYEADAIVDPVDEDDIEPVCHGEGELAG